MWVYHQTSNQVETEKQTFALKNQYTQLISIINKIKKMNIIESKSSNKHLACAIKVLCAKKKIFCTGAPVQKVLPKQQGLIPNRNDVELQRSNVRYLSTDGRCSHHQTSGQLCDPINEIQQWIGTCGVKDQKHGRGTNQQSHT